MAAKGLDPDLAAESLYQSGIIYENSGDSERTILLFERLFNQFKENIHRELVGEWMAVYYDTNAQDLVLKNHLDRMLTEYPESEKIILYLYMRGNIAYREGDYNGSLRFYQNILNIEEEDLALLNETRYRIGYIYTLRKEFSRAKGYFDGILEESDKNELYYRALLSSGICSLNIRETGEAAALFNRVIEGDSSKVWTGDAYYYLGKIAMDEGNYYRASDNFSLAVKVSTTSARRAESLYQLGWSQLRLTRFEDAAVSFETLAADYPDHKLAGESLYRAGIALSYMEEWKASLERFIPALKMIEYASLREELLYQIAWSHFMMEDFPRAMEYLSELQNEFPDSPLPPDGLFRAAEALQERGSSEAAVFSYKQVFDLFPDSPLAETSLFRALSFTEDFRDSLKLMQEYLISFPSVEKAHLIARQIDYRIRQKALTQQEGELIQEILSLPLENSVRAVIQLAQYYGELDSKEIFPKLDELEALEGLREEDLKKIHLYRGIARFKQGESEKAAPLFESLLDDLYADTAAEAQFNLALILLDQEKWKEAADAFLRIRYRYPGQNEWISRGLYEASLAYMKASDFESFNRTAEMLQREYPDSEWNRNLPGKKNPEQDGASETEQVSPDADPDALSPSEELPPIIEAE
jgi:TolA-binding protein